MKRPFSWLVGRQAVTVKLNTIGAAQIGYGETAVGHMNLTMLPGNAGVGNVNLAVSRAPQAVAAVIQGLPVSLDSPFI